MNKFFAQQHHLFLHQLTHSCRLREFDDQVALIDNIIHVIEITMILDEHIKKLFFYVIELSQYLIIMSLSWLHHHVCYNSSYASMLIAMLMTMLMTMFLTIVDRSSLGYRVVSKSTLFRISLCSSESYR